MFFFCRTISKTLHTCVSIFCSYQSRDLTLSAKIDQGYREMPSTNLFCAPAMCFTLWFHPLMSLKHPSILMSRDALWSLAPPHRVTHNTAALLSPLINMGYPSASGRSRTFSSMTHAVTIIRSNANSFIVMVHVSCNRLSS